MRQVTLHDLGFPMVKPVTTRRNANKNNYCRGNGNGGVGGGREGGNDDSNNNNSNNNEKNIQRTHFTRYSQKRHGRPLPPTHAKGDDDDDDDDYDDDDDDEEDDNNDETTTVVSRVLVSSLVSKCSNLYAMGPGSEVLL
ncbi:hypothetical protein HZH66_006978 [Vespula vulgaris]|uniref:Uncharacterized protein n=1 Tax=Vespula vulgaris TaxID=7454 RepID=A0A834JYS8_VESVU|nr:hypothetical protein HZH66_006978 [Vespula vulgaris]